MFHKMKNLNWFKKKFKKIPVIQFRSFESLVPAAYKTASRGQRWAGK